MTRVRTCIGATLALSLCAVSGCHPESASLVEIRGPTMGTWYTVKVAGLPQGVERSTLRAEINARLEGINAAMSTYVPDSEVSRFGLQAGTEWFPVSEETARVVAEALRVGALSGGALDVTVAPVVDLWGFGPSPRRREPPAGDEILRVLESVGLERVEVRPDPPALRKTHAATRIDLSAVAKGFAVDEVARLLESAGLGNYMVEIGGEVRTAGTRAPGAPWRIGLLSPTADELGVRRSLVLRDLSMATSGDYRNFFEHDGKRYSHTIDPRTGRPVTHALASVSVFTPTCMEADALATALLVLGPEEGYRLALERKLAALFISRSAGGELSERTTPAMEELLDTE